MRGTFVNIRLRNHLVEGTEGGFTRHFPDAEKTTIFDAAVKCAAQRGTPLMVMALREYGTALPAIAPPRDPNAGGIRCVGRVLRADPAIESGRSRRYSPAVFGRRNRRHTRSGQR